MTEHSMTMLSSITRKLTLGYSIYLKKLHFAPVKTKFTATRKNFTENEHRIKQKALELTFVWPWNETEMMGLHKKMYSSPECISSLQMAPLKISSMNLHGCCIWIISTSKKNTSWKKAASASEARGCDLPLARLSRRQSCGLSTCHALSNWACGVMNIVTVAKKLFLDQHIFAPLARLLEVSLGLHFTSLANRGAHRAISRWWRHCCHFCSAVAAPSWGHDLVILRSRRISRCGAMVVTSRAFWSRTFEMCYML